MIGEAPPITWCFDPALEALIFLDATAQVALAWSRSVWEPAGFTRAGMRAIPVAPKTIRDQLAKAAKR